MSLVILGARGYSAALGQARTDSNNAMSNQAIMVFGGSFFAPVAFSAAAFLGGQAPLFVNSPSAYFYSTAARVSLPVVDDIAYGFAGLPGSMFAGFGATGVVAMEGSFTSQFADDAVDFTRLYGDDVGSLGMYERGSDSLDIPQLGAVPNSHLFDTELSGKQHFNATNLSEEQVKIATTKSIRRALGLKTNPDGQLVTNAGETQELISSLTTWRRNHYASDPDFLALDSRMQGTIIHSSTSNRIRQLDVQELNVNQRIYGESPYISPATGVPYEYRIPDFHHIGSNTIFDIKPAGTPASGQQFNDFKAFADTDDVRWIFYDNNF